MDLTDASAMTEASGLTDDPAGTSAAKSGTEDAQSSPSLSSSQASAARLADQLREIVTAAPLRSLAAAFVVGVLIARRR
ncbi:hypothetical protein [Bradyrhizobium sp. BR 10261]|uniref:hypothetical protein n=1 Tax=Bradyrhizobium sp. BR 10261 TaxID=2749992 RepID=UPI001C645CD8|nr:hypothetical protein [Bradyrhizobium sp. BR 10261]MBW7962719.1 hypothetical protein [Bradyrhizobium sp. BR 10261]